MQGGWSLLPDPTRTLETCREQSNELAAASGSQNSTSRTDLPETLIEEEDASGHGGSKHGGSSGSAQKASEESDSEGSRARATERLSWRTWLSQKLYAEVCASSLSCFGTVIHFSASLQWEWMCFSTHTYIKLLG